MQLQSEPNENGARQSLGELIVGKCNFSYSRKRIFKKDGQEIVTNARAILEPLSIAELEQGTFTLLEYPKSFDIVEVKYLRNPDGSIHHIELGLV